MSKLGLDGVLHWLRGHVFDDVSCGDLLERFVTYSKDACGTKAEDAFAELVRRHGPKVYGVCRRILRDHQLAEDAFQATFVVLSRKARSIQPRSAVGGFLYGVARKAALEAVAVSRRRKESLVPHSPNEPSYELAADDRSDLALLDEEIANLPAAQRAAVVLCELDGVSRAEAAKQLGVAEGTLSSRLAAARKQLRKRLLRRGVSLSSGMLAALAESAQAVVPIGLTAAAAQISTSVIPKTVAMIAHGVLLTMIFSKLKMVTLFGAATLLVSSLGLGLICGPGQSDGMGNEPARADNVHSKAGEKDRAYKTHKQGDWPMFGGSVSRNMVNPFAKNLPFVWNVNPGKEKNVKWVAELGSSTFGSPVVAGGKVFVGTNNQRPRDPRDIDNRGLPIDLGVLMCFRESDGKFLWQAVHPKLETGRVNDWPRVGLVSTPTVEGDRLYYVSNRCELICADTDTGKAIWRLDMIGELGVFPQNMSTCSPLVVGELVFAVTANGVDAGNVDFPAPQAPSFIAVNKRQGKLVWKDNSPTANILQINQGKRRLEELKGLRDRGEIALDGQWSNPTFAEAGGQAQVIFPGGDGWLRAFDPPTGRLLWKFDANPKNAIADFGGKETRNAIMCTPVVADGRLFFSVGQNPEHNSGVGHLWCIDLAKAVAKGRVNPGQDTSAQQNNFDPKAPVNQNAAFVWHFGGSIPQNLRRQFGRNQYFARSVSTCAIADRLVYAADFIGYLHCLDAETGNVYWSHKTGSICWSSPYCADGKVYLGNDDGTVFVFAHNKEKTLLGENEMPQRVRSIPAVAQSVLFISTDSVLYAISN
jgi:RNA polymerase sigma factor (sigma-70 family)